MNNVVLHTVNNVVLHTVNNVVLHTLNNDVLHSVFHGVLHIVFNIVLHTQGRTVLKCRPGRQQNLPALPSTTIDKNPELHICPFDPHFFKVSFNKRCIKK